MTATPIIAKLREIASKTRQANDVLRFDDVIWVSTHIHDLVAEIETIELASQPIDRFEEVCAKILAHMDTIIEKAAGVATLKGQIEALKRENEELKTLVISQVDH
jgi:hypothetical protein